MDLFSFFGIDDGDGSRITWAHAVNSSQLLRSALLSSAMMLEADVNLLPGPARGLRTADPQLSVCRGQSKTVRRGTLVPFMAHSADDSSDVTLDQWLAAVSQTGYKGVKLDFKSTEAVGPSLDVLRTHRDNIQFPVWLNADIISPGPADAVAASVEPKRFFEACSGFSQSTLSVGWVTGCPPETCMLSRYTWSQVKSMVDVLSESALSETQAISFPVRAVYALRSLPQLRWLYDMAHQHDPSYTIWTNIADVNYTSVDDLLRFRTFFPAKAVFYDVFDWMMDDFGAKKNSFRPGSAERGYLLPSLIETFGLVGSSATLRRYLGSKSIILENGQGFRTKGNSLMSEVDSVEMLLEFSFDDDAKRSRSDLSFALRATSAGSSGLLLRMSAAGSVVLERGTFGDVDFGNSDKSSSFPTWSGKVLSSQSLPPFSADEIASVFVVDSITNSSDYADWLQWKEKEPCSEGHLRKPVFTISRGRNETVALSGSFEPGRPDSQKHCIPAVVFYEGPSRTFAAVENFRLDIIGTAR